MDYAARQLQQFVCMKHEFWAPQEKSSRLGLSFAFYTSMLSAIGVYKFPLTTKLKPESLKKTLKKTPQTALLG